MKSDAEEEAEEEAEVLMKEGVFGWAWVFLSDKRLRRGGAGTGVLGSCTWERSPTSLCLEKSWVIFVWWDLSLKLILFLTMFCVQGSWCCKNCLIDGWFLGLLSRERNDRQSRQKRIEDRRMCSLCEDLTEWRKCFLHVEQK